MPQIVADPPSPGCCQLLPGARIQKFQSLGPDPFAPRGRDARGRFATGSSGNPRGRPPGIRNPRRRVPDLIARLLSAQALSDLLDRKPQLLRPLAFTGIAGYGIPGRGDDPHTLEWGGAIEYSLYYLQNNVRDVGLGLFVSHLTPVVEFTLESPLVGSLHELIQRNA